LEKKKPLIQSLERSLDILEIVRDATAAIRSTDVAQQAGLRVPTANNILRTLFQRGYLRQDANSRYLLGPECFKLYSKASDSFSDLRRVVGTPVRELAEGTGDTAFFGCEYYGTLFCVALSQGGGQLVVSPQQSWLEQLHCTAAGKIVIAEKGVEWYAGLCRREPPKKLTPCTIVTVQGMVSEIEQIRQVGYALSVGESAEEIAALGVAVHDRSGMFVGSLAQSFPALYLESGRIEPARRAKRLHQIAERIAREL
jgi:IclR family acetate operon transcriptional repressor